MAIHYRTKGIILKKRNQGETDELFTIFTEKFGKLELRAISVRKITSKLRGGLELFYLSDIEFIQGKFQKTLTDAVALENFGYLRQDVKRLQLAYRIAELFDKIVQGQEADGKIWNLLHEVFEMLNKDDVPIKTQKLLPYYFLWNLLSYSGYRPLLQNSALQKKNSEITRLIELLLSENINILPRLDIQDTERKRLRITSYSYLIKVFEIAK